MTSQGGGEHVWSLTSATARYRTVSRDDVTSYTRMTAILAAPFIDGFLPHFASRALSRRKTRRVYDASSVCQITTVPIITRRRNVVELVSSYRLAQCNVTVTSLVYRVSFKGVDR